MTTATDVNYGTLTGIVKSAYAPPLLHTDATVKSLQYELRELGLQLGDAHAEIRKLKEERDNALRASRYETDLCQQLLEDLGLYQADAERYRWVRRNPAWESEAFLSGLTEELFDDAIDAAMKETT